MKIFDKNHLPWFLLIFSFLLLTILSFLSEGHYGGADNINHYFISRYAFIYHDLFLDNWGRPLFTILSSPFSQFGFIGIKLFNVLLACLTALVTWRTAETLGFRKSFPVIIFVIFTPVYFLMAMTGLTEILFGFVLMLAVYLFFRKKLIASAIVISFLPITRSEGIVLLPFFFLAFVALRKFKPLPFLLTGFLLFSVIGSFMGKDFFWLITKSPYPLHHPIYKEKGPLLHFINSSPDLFGIPLLMMFLAGTCVYFFLLFRSDKNEKATIITEIWMLVFPVLLFFAVHSILYWQALFGSMGLTRVVTGIFPLACLVCLKGFDSLIGYVKIKEFRVALFYGIPLVVIFSCITAQRLPVRPGVEEQTVKQAANWVKGTSLVHKKIFFTDLNVPFFLDIDPYDNKICEQKWFTKWLDCLPDSTVFIWDAHFGPNECRVPLDTLSKTGKYRLVNIFQPENPTVTLGGYNYEVCVFVKVPKGTIIDNEAIRKLLTKK